MDSQIAIDHVKYNKFFDDFLQEAKISKTNCQLIAVLHVLPDMVPFYRAMEKVFDIRFIIPKPRSINTDVYNNFPKELFVHIEQSDFRNYGAVKEKIFNQCSRDNDLLVLDIGGYFHQITDEIKKEFGGHFLGIVEDTENGLQKYEKVNNIACPVVQVARSPLKENEDYMVGHAVAFSVEAILRSLSILINGLDIGVIGYGKVGKSAALAMKSKQGRVSIFDYNSIRLVHAYSHGFGIRSRKDIISSSDIVISATGNKSLSEQDFSFLKDGCFVVSVTSSDDELNLEWVRDNYSVQKVAQHVSRYTHHTSGQFFYLLNDGNAVNFVHGTTVGDFIPLVHAEIIAAAYGLTRKSYKNGIENVDNERRNIIAKTWINSFTSF